MFNLTVESDLIPASKYLHRKYFVMSYLNLTDMEY